MNFLKLALGVAVLVLLSCGSSDAPSNIGMMSHNAREDGFGIINNGSVRSWSALWHMSQTGSISFCIQNSRNQSETQTLQGYARNAVNQWISRLNQNPPNSSYPSWNRSSIQVSYGCSGTYWTIKMFNGRSNCEYDRKLINLGYNTGNEVLTHEFGHAMGLADTYNYNGGVIAGQPDSMMQSGRFSQDDKYGIWALWKFLVTGQWDCGPGYVRATNGNYPHDQLCKPGGGTGGTGGSGGSGGSGGTGGVGGGGGTCTDRNSNCASWAARGECDKNPNYMLVYCCASCQDGGTGNTGGGGGTCEYRCQDYGYSEGQCRDGWLCTSGCLSYVGNCQDTVTDCRYRCEDYGYREGQCYKNWKCKDGCLIRKKCRK